MSITQEGKILYNETRRIIRNAKDHNRLVLFVGAGASMDSGMPSWSQAIEQIASKLPLSDNDKLYDPLKIPQYYFNSRGKKEYIQLMREVFLYGTPLKITPLHKKLINCQAETIITTNYDHLIEQAAEESNEVRYVISKDSDLPYKNSSRELIKMHGGFENDNFVLKEDDYLQYSLNFRLIETYIKSLIGSKVVLFVGYSLNDPDMKQIFTWVKDVLKDDFQRAYLVLSKVEKNEIERAYFRNLGINLIYTSELVDEWDLKTHTEQLVEFFDYILEDEEEKTLDCLYRELKPLQDLNYVYGKYVKNALWKVGITCDGNEIDLSSSIYPEKDKNKDFKHLLWTYLEKEEETEDCSINTSDWNKLKVIKNVLCKSCITSAKREIDRKYHRVDLCDHSENAIEELMFSFDYQKLDEMKNNNIMQLGTDSPDLYMQQAYICAVLNDYYYAYRCLSTASRIYYKNKQYTWYFIAEFNRKYVGKVCLHPWMSPLLSEEERERLEIEVKAIDLDQTLVTIPDLGHNHNEFLAELSDFRITYNLFYDMFSDALKANEEARTAYSFFAGTAAYEKMQSSAQDYNDYETCNFLILDRYNEIRSIFLLYLRSIFASVMAEDLSNPLSDEDVFSVGNIKQDKLTSFEVYVILRYLSQSDLKKLMKEHDIKFLPCNEHALEYIEKIADSMICAKKYIKGTNFSQDLFWVYLELLSHVKVSEDLATKVLEHLSDSWQEIELMRNRECINHFLVNLCDDHHYHNKKISAFATKMLDHIFDLLIADPESRLHFGGMISYLSYLCKKSENAYDDAKKIQNVSEACKIDFCVEFYSNIGSDAQNLIREQFHNLKLKDSASDYKLYCDAVLAKIIQPDPDTEEKVYEWIRSVAVVKKTDRKSGITRLPKEADYSEVIKKLVNLYLSDQISDIEALSEIMNEFGDSMSRWILNMESFDYANFDCKWLDFCQFGLLKKIAANSIAREKILAAYKKQYESGTVSNNITELIVKFFILNADEK